MVDAGYYSHKNVLRFGIRHLRLFFGVGPPMNINNFVTSFRPGPEFAIYDSAGTRTERQKSYRE